jgi:signal transduction histidine kinase
MPFDQVDSALGRKNEGTGLGLLLVRAMTELHGGYLSLDSSPGNGTTATLLIPA